MSNSQNPPNNLINSKSPYLLQHAHNPVEWNPWSEAIWNTAKEKNKFPGGVRARSAHPPGGRETLATSIKTKGRAPISIAVLCYKMGVWPHLTSLAL